ncbi:mitochondrial potassium channel ATP-binding subunit [Dermacentor albipictus]|uniref:mitochondrial potassium channel ATP-binding subunit n=1 Tax=Dermacentor albipictus TaxID=60249 RepID=UPI0038FCA878
MLYAALRLNGAVCRHPLSLLKFSARKSVASFFKLSINSSLGGLAKTSATSLPAARSSRCYHPLRHIFVFGGGCTVTLSISLGRCLLETRVQCAKHNTRLLDAKKGSTASFNWASFFRFLKPDWLPLLIAVVSALIVAALNIQIPVFLGAVVDVLSRIKSGSSSPGVTAINFFEEIRRPATRLFLIYVMQSVFTAIYISTLSFTGERYATRLRQALLESVLKQDMCFFDKTKTGEIMNCLSGDVQEFKSAFKLCISQGIRSVAQTVGCAISLYFISPKMTMLTVVVMPVMLATGTVFGSFLRVLSRKAQEQGARAAGVADEALSNIRTVRSFAMEDAEAQLFKHEIDKAENLHTALGVGIGCFQGLTNLSLNGVVLGVLYVGGTMMESDSLNAGQVMSFFVSSQIIQRSLSQLFVLFGHYVRGIAAGSRIFELIDLKSEVAITGAKQLNLSTLRGDVEFRHVYFAYSTRPDQTVLEDVSLKLPAGKIVAICGPSGSGKSTIAALLERFYDVTGGSITLDGHDLKELDPDWLRRNVIGLIRQEPLLFATTIKENIRYGKPDATDEEVYSAAKQANAHDFIMSFPRQYDTVVGERGITVSGGQKQRIAIARALLKNPQVLILDEATSALDTESEKVVQAALDRLSKGRTVLVIAHRLSTIRNADIIAVLLDGNIVEIGDHKSLTRLKGVYWKLTQHHGLHRGVG